MPSKGPIVVRETLYPLSGGVDSALNFVSKTAKRALFLLRIWAMAEQKDTEAADRLRARADIARHQMLSIAIPFPEKLDWTTSERTEESLSELYDFAGDLATSVIDWYLQRRRGKKAQSVGLRYASYTFAVAGDAAN